jgi:membrane-associated phospholipid phosphatase
MAFDRRERLWALAHQHAEVRAVARALSPLGDPVVATGVVLVSAAVAVGLRRTVRPVIVGAALLSAAGVAGVLLKDAVGRIGPSFFGEPLVHVGGNAYPSGHELLLVVSWGFAAQVLAGLVPLARLPALVAVGTLSAITGACYVYGPAHWASDVVGGASLGLLLLAVCPAPLRRRSDVPHD